MDIGGAWESTCKILFGQGIGKLEKYADHLKEPVIGKHVKSSLSGKKVFVTSEQYCTGAKFFDYNAEMDEATKGILSKPLPIDEIKDVDSLFGALHEKLIYSGNKVLGNSHSINDSDNVTDSTDVIGSSIVMRSKHIAYCYLLRDSEYAFGCTSSGDCSTIIRCFYNHRLKRCFECATSITSSDCYFCQYVTSCNDCMFSFNLRSARNMIGNVQLEKGQYQRLKSKLLGEIAEDMERVGRPKKSILDIVGADAHA